MKIISTVNAPAAIGSYSQGYETNGLVFTSGQLPITMTTGEMETDIKKATLAALNNVKAIIEEAGMDISCIIKTTVFLRNMDDFAEMNTVYADFFGDHAPARSTIQVAKLPKDAIVEIEGIAAKK